MDHGDLRDILDFEPIRGSPSTPSSPRTPNPNTPDYAKVFAASVALVVTIGSCCYMEKIKKDKIEKKRHEAAVLYQARERAKENRRAYERRKSERESKEYWDGVERDITNSYYRARNKAADTYNKKIVKPWNDFVRRMKRR
tara:strand:+ start:10808 stop:11230 length:423 start_codon:yes stop_codon:yes gene_type:complete